MKKIIIGVLILDAVCFVMFAIDAIERMAGPNVTNKNIGYKIVGIDIDSENNLYCHTDYYSVKVYSSSWKYLYEYQVPPSGHDVFYIDDDDVCVILTSGPIFHEYKFKDGKVIGNKEISIDEEKMDNFEGLEKTQKEKNGYVYSIEGRKVKLFSIEKNKVIYTERGFLPIYMIGTKIGTFVLFVLIMLFPIKNKHFINCL